MHHGVRSMLASKALLADDDTLIVARLGLSVIPRRGKSGTERSCEFCLGHSRLTSSIVQTYDLIERLIVDLFNSG